jgi:hypothetical protein
MEVQTHTTKENQLVEKFDNLNIKDTNKSFTKERLVLQDLSNATKQKTDTPSSPIINKTKEIPTIPSPGIDRKDENDPQAVTEYIEPILSHLRETEV